MDVRIHYIRIPDRRTVFTQAVLLERDDVIVTLLDAADISRPITIDGATALEPGAPIVWFTFPGRWHDIGRFHTRDGRFTGWYANILTPVRFMTRTEWETRDLCLDIWCSANGALHLLDEDEFARATELGWIGSDDAHRAREEAEHVLHAARTGEWPPAIAREWTLERANTALRDRRNARDQAV